MNFVPTGEQTKALHTVYQQYKNKWSQNGHSLPKMINDISQQVQNTHQDNRRMPDKTKYETNTQPNYEKTWEHTSIEQQTQLLGKA